MIFKNIKKDHSIISLLLVKRLILLDLKGGRLPNVHDIRNEFQIIQSKIEKHGCKKTLYQMQY